MCVCLPLVDSLGISEELNNKLKDVLIPERLLVLGHMLGKGDVTWSCVAGKSTDGARVCV